MNIVEKMVEILDDEVMDWKRRYKFLLEPSAGKADLINQYKEIYSQGRMYKGMQLKGSDPKHLVIDVIEIEPHLIDILRGQGYNVVFNDFLEYKPQRYYDLVLANFPFSNGTKHFLKAIEIQARVGGDILAIVNAETIRNTYSNDRKYLKRLLDEYNARIEFVENGFIDAERETNVEIAIIFMKIPMVNKETMFEREFKRDNPDIEFKGFNALTTKMTKLQQLVFEYDLVIKSVTMLFEEKLKVEDLLKGFGLNSGISICNSLTRPENLSLNDFINSTNMKFWDRFISETEFETRLPSKLKDNFRANMQKQQNIAFNMENVRYFYVELMKAIPKSYEETVGIVFDNCTRKYHYSDREWNKNIWGYDGWKTNDCFAINKKVIIPCYLSNASYYRHNIPDDLLDLNIIFGNLTGSKADKDFMYNGEISKAIANNEKKIETTHFILDSYKKGTIHITFKDKTALAQFNLLAAKGKMWLRDGFENTPYEDMTENEKEIVSKLGFNVEEFKDLQLQANRTDYLRLASGL